MGNFFTTSVTSADSGDRDRSRLVWFGGAIAVLLLACGAARGGDLAGESLFATSTQPPAAVAPPKVLVAGGFGASSEFSSAETYDPTAGKFSLTGNMTVERDSHAAARLQNGQVLLCGGANSCNDSVCVDLSSAELYTPASGKFTRTGSMNVPRINHSANLLNDGTVLIAGGENSCGNKGCTTLASAERYSPKTGTFTKTGKMTTARVFFTATTLQNGKVLLAGGLPTDTYGGFEQLLNSAELYDPKTGTFSQTGAWPRTTSPIPPHCSKTAESSSQAAPSAITARSYTIPRAASSSRPAR